MWHRVESAVSSTAAEGMLHTAMPDGKKKPNKKHQQEHLTVPSKLFVELQKRRAVTDGGVKKDRPFVTSDGFTVGISRSETFPLF